MSLSSGFIVLIDRGDHLNYLLQINSIFSLSNDHRIQDSERAFQLFARYYQDVVVGINSLEELSNFSRRIDSDYLSMFYIHNNIQDTDYEIKTKVRALYVSLFIQKSIQLRERMQTVEGEFFKQKQEEMLSMLANQPFVESIQPPGSRLTITDPDDLVSFTRFFVVLQEAQRWQTHAKWEKFAFYVASMAVGEGVWYCPGGAAKPETLRRKHLFAIMERVANRYHKCSRKRKNNSIEDSSVVPSSSRGVGVAPSSPLLLPQSLHPPLPLSSSLQSDASDFASIKHEAPGLNALPQYVLPNNVLIPNASTEGSSQLLADTDQSIGICHSPQKSTPSVSGGESYSLYSPTRDLLTNSNFDQTTASLSPVAGGGGAAGNHVDAELTNSPMMSNSASDAITANMMYHPLFYNTLAALSMNQMNNANASATGSNNGLVNPAVGTTAAAAAAAAVAAYAANMHSQKPMMSYLYGIPGLVPPCPPNPNFAAFAGVPFQHPLASFFPLPSTTASMPPLSSPIGSASMMHNAMFPAMSGASGQDLMNGTNAVSGMHSANFVSTSNASSKRSKKGPPRVPPSSAAALSSTQSLSSSTSFVPTTSITSSVSPTEIISMPFSPAPDASTSPSKSSSSSMLDKLSLLADVALEASLDQQRASLSHVLSATGFPNSAQDLTGLLDNSPS